MIFTGSYLINGMSQILIQQEKDSKAIEIETIKRQVLEVINNVSTVSTYFFFDKELENIAFREYLQYQDNVSDFKKYKAFDNHSKYHSSVIQRISIYLNNPSIVGNSRFVKVNEKIRKQKWYQDALNGRGTVVWRYIPASTGKDKYLSLVRLIQTEKHQNVGVLVINVRDQILKSIIGDKKNNILILLNKQEQIVSGGDIMKLEVVQGDISQLNKETVYCKNIKYQGKAYVMTCLDVKLPETADHIQIVSLQSYQNILKEAIKKSKRSEVFFLLSIAISAVLIILFSRSFSKRVGFFCRQMQKAAAGNFNMEKKLKGKDEIYEMYDYLSTMIWSIQSLLAEIYREQLAKERLKTKQKDAEFKMLASQINPHFLYNSLETIRMMARERGENEIEEFVKMLAGILRHNVQVGNQEVTIESEVTLLEYYLKIQQYRFGERVHYQIKIDEGLGTYKILPLMIQPIVENAIIHGLETKEEGGDILIWIQKKGCNISIIVEDDGLGIDNSRLQELQRDLEKVEYVESVENIKRTHIGISNVNLRIKLLYGDKYGLILSSKKGVGTRVEMIIPLWEAGEDYHINVQGNYY